MASYPWIIAAYKNQEQNIDDFPPLKRHGWKTIAATAGHGAPYAKAKEVNPNFGQPASPHRGRAQAAVRPDRRRW